MAWTAYDTSTTPSWSSEPVETATWYDISYPSGYGQGGYGSGGYGGFRPPEWSPMDYTT